MKVLNGNVNILTGTTLVDRFNFVQGQINASNNEFESSIINVHELITKLIGSVNTFKETRLAEDIGTTKVIEELRKVFRIKKTKVFMFNYIESFFHINEYMDLVDFIINESNRCNCKSYVITNSPIFIRVFQIYIKENLCNNIQFIHFSRIASGELNIEVVPYEKTTGQFINEYPDSLFKLIYELNKRFLS